MALLARTGIELRWPVVGRNGSTDEPHDPEDEVSAALGMEGRVASARAELKNTAAVDEDGDGDPEEGQGGDDEELSHDFVCRQANISETRC